MVFIEFTGGNKLAKKEIIGLDEIMMEHILVQIALSRTQMTLLTAIFAKLGNKKLDVVMAKAEKQALRELRTLRKSLVKKYDFELQ